MSKDRRRWARTEEGEQGQKKVGKGRWRWARTACEKLRCEISWNKVSKEHLGGFADHLGLMEIELGLRWRWGCLRKGEQGQSIWFGNHSGDIHAQWSARRAWLLRVLPFLHPTVREDVNFNFGISGLMLGTDLCEQYMLTFFPCRLIVTETCSGTLDSWGSCWQWPCGLMSIRSSVLWWTDASTQKSKCVALLAGKEFHCLQPW